MKKPKLNNRRKRSCAMAPTGRLYPAALGNGLGRLSHLHRVGREVLVRLLRPRQLAAMSVLEQPLVDSVRHADFFLGFLTYGLLAR